MLQEVTATEYDNHELGIADYYKYFPKPADPVEEAIKEAESKTGKEGEDETEGKKVWI